MNFCTFRKSAVLAAFLLLFSCSGKNESPYDLDHLSLHPEEQKFLVLINQLRSSHGLASLTLEPHLQASSRHHSVYMLQNSELTHSEKGADEIYSDRIKRAGGKFFTSGENVACGTADAQSTLDLWSSDEPHLQAMLDSSHQFIGIAREGDGNSSASECPSFYWTTDFGGN